MAGGIRKLAGLLLTHLEKPDKDYRLKRIAAMAEDVFAALRDDGRFLHGASIIPKAGKYKKNSAYIGAVYSWYSAQFALGCAT